MVKKFILLLLLFIIGCSTAPQVCINKCYNVDLAKTQEERSQGLMNVDNLADNEGMLFIFSKEGNYPFWMKDTLISLDIIWINKDNKVVYVKENAKPCNKTCPPINPNKQAKYVLEVNPESNIQINDIVKIYNVN